MRWKNNEWEGRRCRFNSIVSHHNYPNFKPGQAPSLRIRLAYEPISNSTRLFFYDYSDCLDLDTLSRLLLFILLVLSDFRIYEREAGRAFKQVSHVMVVKIPDLCVLWKAVRSAWTCADSSSSLPLLLLLHVHQHCSNGDK